MNKHYLIGGEGGDWLHTSREGDGGGRHYIKYTVGKQPQVSYSILLDSCNECTVFSMLEGRGERGEGRGGEGRGER